MSGSPQRVLGVDYGTHRIGLALSDPLGVFAQPLDVIKNDGEKRSALAVAEVARQKGAGRIILGLPRNMNGTEGPSAAWVRAFAEKLADAHAPTVELWDERLTTKQAELSLIEGGMRRERRREVIDKVAAQQLLQSWLDHRALSDPGETDDE